MNKTECILAIILGLIMIACPLIAPLAMNTIFALMIIALAIFVFAIGVSNKKTLNIILGIILLIISIIILLNPSFIVHLSAFIIYLVGILLLIVAIINLIAGNDKRIAIIGLIIGIIYIAVASLIRDPVILGILVGIGFIIAGVYGAIADKR